MPKLRVVASLVALLALPTVCAAQSLTPGIWTGKSVSPAGEEVNITFEITLTGDSTHIKLNTIEHGSFDLSEIRVVRDTVRFKFQPGPLVDCVLPKQSDGSYAGTCTAGETGESATMSMVPPRKD